MSSSPPPAAPFPVPDVAGLSREGRRASNEDSAAWVAYGPGSAVAGYVVVCDGMGGHNAGEVASSMALRLLQARIGELASEPPAAMDPAVLVSRVGAWIAEINLAICRSAAANADQAGMGTTLALALVTADGRLVVANVGDSKVFLVRGVVVQQLSVDHTALAEQRRILNKDGGSALDDAANPFFHALTRSLGQEAEVSPDIRADLRMQEGDLIVVTSDGVTDVLESERFLSIVEGAQGLEAVAETTYRLAYDAGSKDNITVALLSVGRPTRLASATATREREEVDLDGTLPLIRPRQVPQPVSGGTAMADATRGSAAPPAAARSQTIRTPLLIGGAVFLGCVAALVVWLASRPAALEAPEAEPTPSAPAAVAPSTPASSVPAPTRVPPTPTPAVAESDFALPAEEAPRPREQAKPAVEPVTIKVPVATPRPPQQRAVAPVAVPSVPTPAPAPTVAVAVPTPEAARTEVAATSVLAVPGEEARLVSAVVRRRESGLGSYIFDFKFDRPVKQPEAKSYRGRPGTLIIPSIRVPSRKNVYFSAREKNDDGFDYSLRPLRRTRADSENVLSFELAESATDFGGKAKGGPLRDGDVLEIDLSGLDWLFGPGMSRVEAPVYSR